MNDFLLGVGRAAATQIVGLFGIFFIFGYLLSKLQEWTLMQYERSVGWKGILWTAWIGTPIHELSHIIFAKIFGHRLGHISLFSPQEATGALGEVHHSYRWWNIFAQTGNFFIGAAPLIGGSTALYGLCLLYLPNFSFPFSPFLNQDFGAVISSMKDVMGETIATIDIRSWHFWLFIYVSFCIASHLAPSRPDRRTMWRGFGCILLLLLIANSIALLAGLPLTAWTVHLARFLGVFSLLFSYALVVSIVHFVAVSILTFPLRWWQRR